MKMTDFISFCSAQTYAIQKINILSKKEGKDQETIQSRTTPDPGYQWESGNVTIRHHKREPRGDHKASTNRRA